MLLNKFRFYFKFTIIKTEVIYKTTKDDTLHLKLVVVTHHVNDNTFGTPLNSLFTNQQRRFVFFCCQYLI